MYEDDPQDKVFDVLGEAVFGDHPLGRAIIGRAEVVGGAPGRAAGASTPRATCPAQRRHRGGRLGRPRRARRARPAPPGSSAPARCRRRCRGRAATRPPRMRFVAKDTEQYHVCLGAPGHPARRRPPLRAARPRQHPRRHVVVAAVPGGPREARPGVQRLLVPVDVRRHGPGRPLPRHAAGQRRARRWASSPTSSSACARTRPRPTSSRAPRRTSRAASCCRSSRRRARMNRLGASVLADMPLLSRRRASSSASTPSRSTTSPRWPRDLFAPERMSAAGIGADAAAFRRALEPISPALVGEAVA